MLQVWMWNHIKENIMMLFRQHPNIQPHIPELEHEVAKGTITPGFAADILLEKFSRTFNSRH